MSYQVRGDGWVLGTFATLDLAKAACRSKWPAAEIGHSGDLEDGGRRTLVWETPETPEKSENDAGYAACAQIVSGAPW